MKIHFFIKTINFIDVVIGFLIVFALRFAIQTRLSVYILHDLEVVDQLAYFVFYMYFQL